MTVGAVLVLLGGLLMGLSGARELTAKVKRIEQAMTDLSALEREVCTKCAPLPEAVRAAERSGGPLLRAFGEALEQLGCENTAACWDAAICAAELPAEAANALRALGSVLGRFSAEEQRTAFEEVHARLEVLHQEARERSRSLGRVYLAGGVCGGVVLVALLL